ncbi:MAG TPA: hypothetical protein VHP58_04370 [Alphaproteobacteria bacterium]|nr:hypothetical protein [Alphaproteobacteria bacterium]
MPQHRWPWALLPLAVLTAPHGYALEKTATPTANNNKTAASSIQQVVLSTANTSMSTIGQQVSATIVCAQSKQLYNSDTGSCIQVSGGTSATLVAGPFSQSFTTPGTFSFTIPPSYTMLSIYLFGASGGCTAGTTTSFGSIWAGGGGAGPGGCGTGYAGRVSGRGTSGGGGGGDYTIAGGGPQGGNNYLYYYGGSGGFTRKDFIAGTAGAPAGGSVVQVIVGAAGSRGSNGRADIYWVQ